MALSIPTSPPSSMTVGSTAKWTVDLGDFLPADGWILTVTLAKADKQFTFAATDNGDGTHLVTISKTAAASFTSGRYRLTGAVESSGLGERYVLNGEGGRPFYEFDVEIRKDAQAEIAGLDQRTTIEKVVDDLEALLLLHEQSAGHVSSYSFPDGRATVFQSPHGISEALRYWRGRRQVEIRAENMKRGTGNRGMIKSRLS